MASSVREGDPAPDFTMTSAQGEVIHLAAYRGKSEVVLFFYPKDDSPACTAEACSFRDSYEDFLDAGAVVIGVSADPAGEHRAFAGKHRLPFPLLTDSDGSLRARYGVPKTLGLIPGRVTYLIDREGVVRNVYSSQFRPSGHVRETLKALRELRGPGAVAPG
ncbi:peroxiredoxin [Tundrisphaera lichenicola]|uniref:peroxiredoxin n=1 Tax=Tundrisphaera lichenicola TaxID=2029860 RepID=UPI003EBB4692